MKYPELLGEYFTRILGAGALFLLAALPVVTLPAALTALYAVTGRMARGELVEVRRTFFSVFKRRFWRAEALGALALVAVAIALTAVAYYLGLLGQHLLWTLVLSAAIFGTLVLLFAIHYAIILADGELPTVQVIQRSVRLALGNLPGSLLALAAWCLPLLAAAVWFPTGLLLPALSAGASAFTACYASRKHLRQAGEGEAGHPAAN